MFKRFNLLVLFLFALLAVVSAIPTPNVDEYDVEKRGLTIDASAINAAEHADLTKAINAFHATLTSKNHAIKNAATARVKPVPGTNTGSGAAGFHVGGAPGNVNADPTNHATVQFKDALGNHITTLHVPHIPRAIDDEEIIAKRGLNIKIPNKINDPAERTALTNAISAFHTDLSSKGHVVSQATEARVRPVPGTNTAIHSGGAPGNANADPTQHITVDFKNALGHLTTKHIPI